MTDVYRKTGRREDGPAQTRKELWTMRKQAKRRTGAPVSGIAPRAIRGLWRAALRELQQAGKFVVGFSLGVAYDGGGEISLFPIYVNGPTYVSVEAEEIPTPPNLSGNFHDSPEEESVQRPKPEAPAPGSSSENYGTAPGTGRAAERDAGEDARAPWGIPGGAARGSAAWRGADLEAGGHLAQAGRGHGVAVGERAGRQHVADRKSVV